MEDSKRLRYFVSRGLIGLVHAVDCADPGENADRLVHENEYDIVILDLMLPWRGRLSYETLRCRRAGRPLGGRGETIRGLSG